jgi:hypothetical protein
VKEGCAEDDEEKTDGKDLNHISVDANCEVNSPKAYEGECNDGLETCRRHGGCLAAGFGLFPMDVLLQGQGASMRPGSCNEQRSVLRNRNDRIV